MIMFCGDLDRLGFGAKLELLRNDYANFFHHLRKSSRHYLTYFVDSWFSPSVTLLRHLWL
jgi:hypothetical protein